ncbi:MAG TPA: cytochrome c [Anaerolineales bacterium]|nr:cytochrome c [Anaerolineales bacterium]
MKKGLLPVIFILNLLVLIACGTSQTADLSTPAPVPTKFAGKTNPLGAEASVDGAEVFEANCQSCHGSQGHGDGIAAQSLDPKPKNLAELQAIVGDDYLFWRIHQGKPGTAMIGWNGILTDEQIWQAVSFIRTLK